MTAVSMERCGKRGEQYIRVIDNNQPNRSRVCLPQPAHDVLLRRHRIVLLGIPRSKAMRQTRDLGVEIRIAEESYRLAFRSDDFEIVHLLGRRGDDAVEGRTQDVVAPASEKVGSIDDDRAGLRRQYSSWMSHLVRKAALTIGGAGENCFVVGF